MYSPNFSPSNSHTILVFPYRTLWQYSDGDPLNLNGGVECMGYEKNRNFDKYLGSSRK